jgi:putative protein kinase ArgK-like GTPase of G3E family
MPKGVLGRNNLLGSITERLDELADGRGGSLGVIGDPGVGKSTILAAVISESRSSDSAPMDYFAGLGVLIS